MKIQYIKIPLSEWVTKKYPVLVMDKNGELVKDKNGNHIFKDKYLWHFTKNEWEINSPKGFGYDPYMTHEAQNKKVIIDDGSIVGKIIVGNKFFDLTLPQRKHVLLHEDGHTFDNKLHSNDPEFFWKINDSGIFGIGKTNQSGKTYWEGILGTFNNCEAMAESYAVYYSEPKFLKKRHPLAYQFIQRVIKGENAKKVLSDLMENKNPMMNNVDKNAHFQSTASHSINDIISAYKWNGKKLSRIYTPESNPIRSNNMKIFLNKNQLFTLGKEVLFKVTKEYGSVLRPQSKDIAKAAKELGISQKDARIALNYYNYGHTYEEVPKVIHRKNPISKVAKKSGMNNLLLVAGLGFLLFFILKRKSNLAGRYTQDYIES